MQGATAFEQDDAEDSDGSDEEATDIVHIISQKLSESLLSNNDSDSEFIGSIEGTSCGTNFLLFKRKLVCISRY